MKTTAPVLALSLLFPACALADPAKAPAEKCAPYTLNGKPVVAKRTAAGNLSTTACEPEITVRLRAGKPDGRALNGAIPHKAGAGIILRKATMNECTVWIYEDVRRPDADTILLAWDLCSDSMHHALEEAISK